MLEYLGYLLVGLTVLAVLALTFVFFVLLLVAGIDFFWGVIF